MGRLWSVLMQPTNRQALYTDHSYASKTLSHIWRLPLKAENGNDLCPYCFRFILQIYQPALRIQTICALRCKNSP